MTGYVLETLAGNSWCRGGETFWTLDAAQDAGRRLIRRSLARRVRILPVDVDPVAVCEFPVGA